MPAEFSRIEAEVRTALEQACKRDYPCDFITEIAGEIAYRATRAAQPISPEQVQGRTERISARISGLCTGRLIDKGCLQSPLCPASTEGETYARLRRIKT